MANTATASAKDMLGEAIADGLLPHPSTWAPPYGANADWDTLLTGMDVEQAIINGQTDELRRRREEANARLARWPSAS